MAAPLPRRVRKQRTHVEILAKCFQQLQEAEATISEIDLRTTSGDLRASIRELRQSVTATRAKAFSALQTESTLDRRRPA